MAAVPPPPPHHILRDECAECAQVLAAAFARDPVFEWMLPDRAAEQRAEELIRFFEPSVEFGRVRGHAYATADARAVALWSPPGVEFYDGPGLDALVTFFIDVIGERAAFVGAGLTELSERHPTEPHFYLAVLGTEPASQGRGLGTSLLEPVLTHCDATALPAYLESSAVRNVPFYERHGFRVIEEFTLPDGPIMRPMWRDPQVPS